MSLLSLKNEVTIPIVNPFLQSQINYNKSYYYKIKNVNKNGVQISVFKEKGDHIPREFKILNNNIYFLSFNSLFKITSVGLSKVVTLPAMILHYTIDKNNHIWLGTVNHGLYELNEKDSILNHYLNGVTINHVLFDSQHGLWLTSEGLGVFYCRNIYENYPKTPALLNNFIYFIKKIDNKIFIGNSLEGLTIIENNNKISTHNIDEPLDVIKYESGYIVCCRHYLEFIQIHNKKIIQTKLPPIKIGFNPNKLFNINNKSILCIGSTQILELKKGIKSISSENVKKVFKYKIYFFAYRNGISIIATDNGVYEVIDDKLVQPNYLLPTKNCIVTKIVKDSLNNFWFCTKGSGLFKLLKNNTLIHYTTTNNLPSQIIHDISFTANNSALLSTNKGLFYHKESSSQLNNWHELYADEVKSTLSDNHTLYLATAKGLITMREDEVEKDKFIYFNITSILINGINFNLTKLHNLNYNENNLEINMDVISYSSNTPQVKYILSGAENKSGYTSAERINFQNLAIGNYTLTLSLYPNEFIAKPIVIPFSIIPAFWQTVWFKVLCFIMFLFSSFLVSKLIFTYYKRKEEKKNTTNKLITEYKLIALKAQINPHFMSNCLTAIQHLIISNKVDEANQYLAKFSLLVRQVLNFSSKSLVTLHEELNITELNIELEQLRFEHKFDFAIELPESINLKTIFIPPLLLQPITENAIWHGLLPLKKTRQGKLLIKINVFNNLLHITIEDNGVGRNPESSTIGNIKDSKGILITKQRIENINEFYKINSANLFYEDLKTNDNKPYGTRVNIVLPLNLNTI